MTMFNDVKCGFVSVTQRQHPTESMCKLLVED